MRLGKCSFIGCDSTSENSLAETGGYFTCECKDGFKYIDDECIACPENCRYCSSEAYCDFCDFGFYMEYDINDANG